MSEEIIKPSIFFIIGRSRSGTTLLKAMLDSHPEVYIPNECTFIFQLSGKYKNKIDWSPKIIDSFIRDLKRTWLFENLKLDIKEFTEALIKLSPKLTYSEVCKQVISYSRSTKDINKLIYIGDKNPSYSLYLKTIYSIFKEDCKYIYINRDYRDQYWSLINAKFEIPNTVVSAKRWVKAFHNFKRISSKNPTICYLIKYENLVNDPNKELLNLCDFLGITYNQTMLRFNDPEYLKSTFSKKSLDGIHKSIKEPLTRNKINSWEKNLSNKELKILDRIAGNLEIHSGYKPRTKINYFTFLTISFSGYFLYWLILLSSQILKIVPFNFYLKLSEGSYLGKIWNNTFRKN